VPSQADVAIRPLATHAEFVACVELQRATWGRDFRETVPPSILLVAQKLGGVAAGAFSDSNDLLGFVFGITGVRDGEVVHWSDMLAVRADAQGKGIGRLLKEHQRAAAARAGAGVVAWTYDPLMARNAHLNFNVFGVSVAEYVPNMYGRDTGNALNRGVDSDRLVVEWQVDDAALAERRQTIAAASAGKPWDDVPTLGDAEYAEGDAYRGVGKSDRLRIAIPLDTTALLAGDPVRAAQWREANRAAFQRVLHAGYRVNAFTADRGRDRGYYLLTR
jgi:predicted GNAT superfamily acetyltransferase